jgi:hypothetical protein
MKDYRGERITKEKPVASMQGKANFSYSEQTATEGKNEHDKQE